MAALPLKTYVDIARDNSKQSDVDVTGHFNIDLKCIGKPSRRTRQEVLEEIQQFRKHITDIMYLHEDRGFKIYQVLLENYGDQSQLVRGFEDVSKAVSDKLRDARMQWWNDLAHLRKVVNRTFCIGAMAQNA
ncbi:MAG: hypothetical protein Q9201_000419 [Fulgogasparrea decipioides]